MKKKMDNIMVDIETLGNKSNSVILSIAAVYFDLQTGKTGKEFTTNIDIQSCLDAGLKIDADTVKWWLSQNEQAREKILCNDAPLLIAGLKNFGRFLNSDAFVWGNSARFDLGILENAYQAFNINIPWKWHREMDVRTLALLYPKTKSSIDFIGLKHYPIDDCKHQIKYLCEIYNQLN